MLVEQILLLQWQRQRNRPFCYNSDVGRNRPRSYDGRGRKTYPFAAIQILVGTDLVPTIAESEEDPFSHNSDVGRNRFCYYDGRGTDPLATIQMLVGGRNRS